MEQTKHKVELRQHYDDRNVDGIIQLVSEVITKPTFPALNRRLVKEGKLPPSTLKLEEITSALLTELEEEIKQDGDVIVQDNYFEVAEQLKNRFSEAIADIYINTKTPNNLLSEVRQQHSNNDAQLSECLINQYKNELIRIEDGRRAILKILQQHSNFPVKNVILLSELLEQLHLKLKSNYRYLTVKPYFLSIFESGDSNLKHSEANQTKEVEVSNYTLFADYVAMGHEPTLSQQVRFRIDVIKLFQYLWKRKILPVAEHKRTIALINSYFNYRGDPGLSGKARQFLEDLIVEINTDQTGLLKKLAQTFVNEYRHAEKQMGIRCGMIESELANTKEFLRQLSTTSSEPDLEKEQKAQVALEKIMNLEGVFKVQPAQEKSAANASYIELERIALGVSSVISPKQITDWIRIYSILFSNSEFLKHSKETIDFSIMRKYISDLTTYHLIQSVSELKLVIDSSLATSTPNKPDHFKQFGELLKIKLQSLMRTKKEEEEKTFHEMIKELDFLDNSASQFVIAETFKGFQAIADAFSSTVNDYFVRDRETLLKESRTLYTQICSQCLKNVIVRPTRPTITANENDSTKKENKSWLGRLFS